MRRLLILLTALALFTAACGDDGGTDSADDDTTTTSTTEAPAPEPEEPAEEPEEPAEEPEEPAEAPVEEPSATTVDVTLTEWEVDTEAELAAGAYFFDIINVGQFPHQFGVVRGASYDDLPKLDNGAIDETAVAADILGISDNIDSGTGGTLDLTLEPGNYVFFCNINLGPNSHAANGQTLSVTVT